MNLRLDEAMAHRGLVSSRSQAESYIKLKKVKVNSKLNLKPETRVSSQDKIEIIADAQFVSRAGLKLASVVQTLSIEFKNKIVLDVGSSTGGFTDYSIRCGADKVIAVEVGSNQMHKDLRTNPKVELHEQCDIRDFKKPKDPINIVLIDVSFISLRAILPAIYKLADNKTEILAMFKPQFEADGTMKNKGIIKNSRIRRDLIKEFEKWLRLNKFYIIRSVDSEIAGSKGNLERFFLLKKVLP